VKAVGLAAAKLYVDALEQFGGSTSSLSEELSAFNIFSWLKAHFEILPSFVEGAIDFEALASATNFAKMLAQGGCPRMESIQEEKFEGPSSLGTISRSLRRSVKNFMKSFWVEYDMDASQTSVILYDFIFADGLLLAV
jgi:hypothetical protein